MRHDFRIKQCARFARALLSLTAAGCASASQIVASARVVSCLGEDESDVARL